jgi:vacuolar-type H+-ATPase subunit H
MTRKDVLRTIRDAENAATETISNAKKEASSIISKARLNASEIVISGRSNSEAEALNLITSARADAGDEASIVSSAGDSATKNIHGSGKKNRSKATKIVIDAFKN